jgi:putative salt-induced outer membrane protein YdiY
MRSFFVFLLALIAAPLAIAQDAPPPPPWTSSLGAGVALTSGNTDTTNFNFAYNTAFDPKTVHVFKAEAVYLYGESEGEKQTDKGTARARYERLLSDRAFWFGETSILRDPLKDIDYLIAPVAGAGLHLIKTDLRKLSVDGGVGAAFESGDVAGSDSRFVLQGGENFEWQISEPSKLTQRFTALWDAEDPGDALYHFDAGLTTTVARFLELKISYLYDYKTEPPPEFEEGDSALFAALLVKW